jgi:hypothetical protein
MLYAPRLAREGPCSRGDPEGGARLGVLRPRLATVAREVRGNDGWVLRPSCEELSLQASAPMPEWEARVPGPKIAKVERREGECTAARCTPRLASAAQFAPLGAPPPLIRSGKKIQNPGAAAPRDRKTLCLTKGSMENRVRHPSRAGHRFRSRPATPVERWTMRAGQLVCYLTRTTRVLPTEGPFCLDYVT